MEVKFKNLKVNRMKLYVGNIPHAYQEKDLEEVFSEFGTVVSAKVIIDRVTGRSKGFGFVEMGSKEEGEKAVEELNGKEVGGRAIVVNEARPQEKRERRPFGGGGGGGGGGGSNYKRRF